MSTSSDQEHVGFLKEAGVRQVIGRGIKALGRGLGSSRMERAGFKMQHGVELGNTVRTPAKVVRRGPSEPRMELKIPHGTPKEQADVMTGRSKAKARYVQPHMGRGRS